MISLPPVTPIYAIGTGNARSQTNLLAKRVAYSYPYDFLDGHFDSPFDFKKKLLMEQQAIRDYHAIHLDACITETTTVGNGSAPGAVTNDALKQWSSTEAPVRVWGRYLMANFYVPAAFNGVSAGVHYSFIPGLRTVELSVRALMA